ncbi:M16 family metallopeptidase [Clostridium prolinivorans]|uniref:M16 family metallopeptidase n=1 Tax=Clostridium prolinivorans TaxID=2769420 RepID=UPI000FDA0BD8|nr:pitrilysin family protein [Clostridium prolinivorans]
MFDGKITILENGLKIISVKKDTQIASIHIGIKIGSLYEKGKNRGLSHFIEHMLFKGTKKRNNEELNEALEKRGGEYNAYTDYTSTVYSITALNEELEDSIEILADMVQNPVFDEKEIEKEKGVILAEIKTSKDDIEDFSFNKIHEIAFDKSPLKYDTLGEEKTVKKFTRDQILEFYDTYYIPNNSIISIVSSYEHDEIINLINKYFKNWKPKKLKEEPIIIENNKPTKNITYKSDIEQCTIIYAYTFHGLNKKEELALKILNHKLGESPNSILFRELREEKGLAYDVYSHVDMTNFVKILYIYTAVEIQNINSAMLTIENCINKIINKEIDFNEDTVLLMKKVLKTAVCATLEDSTELSNYCLHQSLENESIYQFEEDMKFLEFIKKEDIYDVAKKVFKNPTIHILMPK